MGYNGATAIRISTMVSGGTPKRELGTTNMLEWVHTTYKHHNVVVYMHARTGTNTANLSKPTACMNRSIASTIQEHGKI